VSFWPTYPCSRRHNLQPLALFWGTLATVRILQVSPSSQKSRFYKDLETPESPRTPGDLPKAHPDAQVNGSNPFAGSIFFQRF
jgi:hypothetical protein